MDSLSFAALAEPNRLRIVELLRERPLSVNQIVELLGIRQPQASKHLGTLSKAGIVKATPLGQQRVYALEPEVFIDLERWADSFQKHWDQKLDNLELMLKLPLTQNVPLASEADEARGGVPVGTLTMDESGAAGSGTFWPESGVLT